MFCAFSDISGPKFYALGKSIRVITIKREHGSLKIAESAGNYTDKPVSPALSSPNLVLTSFFCPILIYQSSQCRRGTPAFAVWPFPMPVQKSYLPAHDPNLALPGLFLTDVLPSKLLLNSEAGSWSMIKLICPPLPWSKTTTFYLSKSFAFSL